MTDILFEDRYKKLNAEQREAVDTIDGPVLVVAGPGSGKTEILSMRVGNILRKTDTSAGAILCLTFTDSAAVNMRERLAKLIGTDAYRVKIHTFHSFGVSIINRFPEYFFDSAEFNPADKVTQIETLSDIFKELPHGDPLKSEHPEQGFVFLGSTLQSISQLKKAGITADEFEKILEHNEAVLEVANPLVAEVFGERLSKKDIEAVVNVAEKIRKSVSVTKDFPMSQIKPLNTVIADSLAEAARESEKENKTAPLSAWKTSWTKKDDEGNRILKDYDRVARMRSLAHAYREYQKKMFAAGYYDFDDMLLQTIEVIEKTPSLALTLQEEYQYILVDEFQDTNDAQMRLLKLLTSADVHEGRPNIMAVGDDDQAIYKFQGAEIANILQFKELYRDPKIITLSKNYRSSQKILDFAHGVISQSKNSLQNLLPEVVKELKAAQNNISLELSSRDIVYRKFHTDLSEYQYVAREIRRLIDAGTKPKDVAVISRTHEILQSIVPYLYTESVPIEYEKQQNVFDLQYIHELVTVVKFIDSIAQKKMEEADELLPEILSYGWWGLTRKIVWSISMEAQGKSWLSVMESHSDRRVQEIAGFLIGLGERAKSEPLERVIDLIIGSATLVVPDTEDDDSAEDTQDVTKLDGFESPFRHYYFADKLATHKGQYIAFLSGLRVFVQTLREYKQGKALYVTDLVELVTVYEKNKMALLDTSPFSSSTDSITLMTSHKAKGLEFAYVFVVAATDEIWNSGGHVDRLSFPKNMPIKPSEENTDDALRLFFVALTRAKHSLYVTYHEKNAKGKSVLPIEFLSGVEASDGVEENLNSDHPLESAWRTLSKPPYEADEKAMLQHAIQDYRMSVTHLNNFLDVSRGGPKIFLEQNLLRFPQAKTPSNVYGTAMHFAMQCVYTHVKKHGKIPELENCLETFRKQIYLGRLNPTDTRLQIERGEKVLKLYYELRSDRFDPLYKIEYDFKHEGVALGEACITGKIDKMIVKGSNVEVYDFKTSRAKLSWEDSDAYGATQLHKYKNQLMFYKLLVEHSHQFAGSKVSTGVLEFLELYKGAFVDLSLKMEKEETDRLASLIEIVYKKILTFDFPDTTQYSPDLKGTLEFEKDLLEGKI